MEQRNFESLIEKVQDQAPATLKQRIRQAFEAVRDNGDLLTLSRDEFRLLFDYRNWKSTPASVSGVFHWKRPSNSVLQAEVDQAEAAVS